MVVYIVIGDIIYCNSKGDDVMKIVSATLLLISAFWMIIFLYYLGYSTILWGLPIVQICISGYLFIQPLLKNGSKNW